MHTNDKNFQFLWGSDPHAVPLKFVGALAKPVSPNVLKSGELCVIGQGW